MARFKVGFRHIAIKGNLRGQMFGFNIEFARSILAARAIAPDMAVNHVRKKDQPLQHLMRFVSAKHVGLVLPVSPQYSSMAKTGTNE